MDTYTQDISEKTLLIKLIEGDSEAFEKIYFLYQQPLSRHAFRLTKSRFITEEIIQEVFLKLWIHKENLTDVTSIKSYLFRMVKNRGLNYLRDLVQHEDLAGEWWHDLLQSKIETDQYLITKDYTRLINDIVERLPEQKRYIYKLSRQEGKRNSEIAKQLGITTKTVENHLWRTLQIIKKSLEPHLNTTMIILLIVHFG